MTSSHHVAMRVVILNELNLAGAIWDTCRGRSVYFAHVRAILPFAQSLMEALVRRMAAGGRLHSIRKLDPRFERFFRSGSGVRMGEDHDFPDRAYCTYTRVFLDLEETVDRIYGLRDLHGPNADAIRKAVCNHFAGDAYLFFLIGDLDRRPDASTIEITGIDRELPALVTAFLGQQPRVRLKLTAGVRRPVNFASALAAAAGTIVWVLLRTRLRPPPPEQVDLGVDFMGSPEEITLVEDIAKNLRSVVYVLRESRPSARSLSVLADRRRALRTDGRLPLSVLPGALKDVVRDLSDLWTLAQELHPALAWRIFGLARWRAIYRALVQRYHFRRFLGRDDYNIDHIVRSQEIRASGGLSFGFQHGIPVLSVVHPLWRQIDFDRYYVLGIDLVNRHYRARWPEFMKVVAVGSRGMTCERTRRVGRYLGRDIVVFTGSERMAERMLLDAVSALAAAFPDRTIYNKPKRPQAPGTREIALGGEAPGNNIVITREDPYELMLRCRYAVNASSTLGAEAIQFGLVSLVLDAYSEWPDRMDPLYREYAGLSVTSIEALIERIRAIESEAWQAQPQQSFEPLIARPREGFAAAIREDLEIDTFNEKAASCTFPA
jgi:hypothetical protein